MERKIGEIFEYKGEWYQCVKGDECKYCNLRNIMCHRDTDLFPPNECVGAYRKDNTSVIFKKLEKIGEPHFIEDEIFEGGKVYVQNFKVYKDFEGHKPICNDYILYDWKNRIISIEIKQNKENMEEYRMYDAKEDIPEFDKVVDECLFGKDKLNLKPFDLEAAKAGKPVCTRDGRKARIICFDRKDIKPIVALVTSTNGTSVIEKAFYYFEDGYHLSKNDKNNYDLMMLPEKKEGWVNVYGEESNNNERLIEQTIYKTRKDAFDNACPKGYITTTKINWEE